ncbi:heme-binding protein 1-like [Brienomyrus brachyistius]|uniref:heme-binding protein 1-like n=1 Tax=Brienomyrus brachyistius TaxID=42636 RepID=UPI0020B2E2F7|nr:heme-binding protein 1-like [Brienomyrus brachyistius]
MFGIIKNSIFGTTEESKYDVLSNETKEEGTYEIRKYKAARYATLTSEGKPFDQSTGECMKKMLLYVGGSNDKGEGMGMTAPVCITVFPKDDGTLQDRVVVGLRLPERYQENPPTPTDSSIQFEDREALTVYVARFGGYAHEKEYCTEAARLTQMLGEGTTFQKDKYFCCGYDPPVKPYGRRNEVWFIKEEH